MRSRITLLAALAALSLAAGLSSARAQTRVAGERPQCVQVSTTARFDGVGYGHWVSIRNTCAAAIECDVSTDVAPATVHVSVPRGEQREINTFLSSPAREFTATVTCPER